MADGAEVGGAHSGELATLIAAFERELARNVFDTVSAAALADRAYCVVLNYSTDPCRGVIPVVGVGLRRAGESVTLPAGRVPRAQEHWWNPAEFSTLGDRMLQPRSPTLLSLDRRVAAACVRGEEVDTRAICNRVAAELNARDWSPLGVGEPFVVYAVDDDLADLDENLGLATAARKS